jgi:hypothetical protein
LETIFTGLLRANPDYLAVGYLALVPPNGEQAGAGSQEILRVDRNANDRAYVRTVPASRLVSVENNGVLSDVVVLEPGDVRLTVADPRGQPAATDGLKRISTCVPIYDEATGRPFGMVAIETDLVAQLEAVLLALGTIDGVIYVTDGKGNVLASAGSSDATDGAAVTSIPAAFPELEPMFAADFDASTRTNGRTYIARRMRVDETSDGVAIVARLPE